MIRWLSDNGSDALFWGGVIICLASLAQVFLGAEETQTEFFALAIMAGAVAGLVGFNSEDEDEE